MLHLAGGNVGGSNFAFCNLERTYHEDERQNEVPVANYVSLQNLLKLDGRLDFCAVCVHANGRCDIWGGCKPHDEQIDTG